jgi:hypothetical protein
LCEKDIHPRQQENMSRMFQVIRPGAVCTDIASGLEVTVTHWFIDMNHTFTYLTQPKGVNPEDGQPLDKVYLCGARLQHKPKDMVEVDIPVEILGSQVEDKATGFKGMGIELIQHINGCFHVVIQPKGVVKKTKQPIRRNEFDIRGCKGPKIPNLTKKQKKKSEEDKPSPSGGNLIQDRQISSGIPDRRG